MVKVNTGCSFLKFVFLGISLFTTFTGMNAQQAKAEVTDLSIENAQSSEAVGGENDICELILIFASSACQYQLLSDMFAASSAFNECVAGCWYIRPICVTQCSNDLDSIVNQATANRDACMRIAMNNYDKCRNRPSANSSSQN